MPRRTRSPSGPSGSGGHGVVLVVEREVPEPVLGLGTEHPPRWRPPPPRPARRRRRGRRWRRPGWWRPAGASGRRRAGAPRPAASSVPATQPARIPRPRMSPSAHSRSPDPLEAEHRVEEVDRQHRVAPGGVGGGQGGEGGDPPGLGDPLLEELARGALGVAQRQVGVDRHVALALGGVDLGLGDDRLHAEGARLVGHDRRHQRAEGGVADQVPQQAGEGHGGGDRLVARARR